MKVVAFDLDGTILASMPQLTAIGVDVLSKHYQLPLDGARVMYLASVGRPFPGQVNFLYGDDHRNAAAIREYAHRKRAVYANARPFPDVKPALEDLKTAGWLSAVVSSTETALVRQAVKGLPFTWVSGLDQGAKEAQLTQLLSQDKQLYFVGDAPYDATLWPVSHFIGVEGTVSRAAFGPCHVVRSVSEAADWLVQYA